MGKLKCPECNSCMDFLWIGTQRYVYCGFCHVYRQGRNDNLQIVPSPYGEQNTGNKVDDPLQE